MATVFTVCVGHESVGPERQFNDIYLLLDANLTVNEKVSWLNLVKYCALTLESNNEPSRAHDGCLITLTHNFANYTHRSRDNTHGAAASIVTDHVEDSLFTT